MDALDLKIVREMGIRPYSPKPQDVAAASDAAIAKRLAVDLKTVKARVAKMEETGFIHAYEIVPNLGHFGLRADAYLFKIADADAKTGVLERVAGIGGILEVHDFLGAEACVDMAYATSDELASKLKLASDITRDPAPTRFYDRPLPKVARQLSPLDWRIVAALRGRANRPLAEVAEALHVSLKTVRRRFDRMVEEGSIFIVPMLNPAKASGLVLFELLIYTNPDAPASTLRETLHALDDHHVYHYVPTSRSLGNFDVLLFAGSTGQIQELRERARRVPGVARVDPLLFQGWFDHSGWMDERIARATTA